LLQSDQEVVAIAPANVEKELGSLRNVMPEAVFCRLRQETVVIELDLSKLNPGLNLVNEVIKTM
jgi:hypothetical protein